MSSNDWSKQNDEVVILTEAEFKLGKYIKIAPNFRMNTPSTEELKDRYYAYISCCFGL